MKYIVLCAAIWVAAAALVLGADGNVPAKEQDCQTADEAAIRKAVETYVATFNKADAKALAAMWSPEAVYTNPLSGEQVVGRPEIEKQFAAIFSQAKGAKLEAKTDSVRFVSPNVAVEQGSAKVIRPDQTPDETTYTAVYVKRDGQWLLDRVTEESTPVVVSNYEHLKEIEWMIGTWVDQDDQNRIETTCAWTKNQNFMTRAFTMSIRDRLDMSGMQFVGWDPINKKIRSWVFDSDGGFGEGEWRKKGNRWYIHSKGTTSDGKKMSSVNIITYVDDNTFTWQSVDRSMDGELLPNVDEVTVVRQSSTE